MEVLLTLTSFGSDTGPFDIYTDTNNFTLPFYTNISQYLLSAGFTINVSDTTKIVKIQSKGDCISSVSITLNTTPPETPFYITGVLLASNGDVNCLDVNTGDVVNYVYVAYNAVRFTEVGGINVVKSLISFDEMQIYNSDSPGTTIHPNSITTHASTIFENTGAYDGTYMIAVSSSENGDKMLLVVSYDLVNNFAVTTVC